MFCRGEVDKRLLIRRSLDEGIFPFIFKFSSTTPILKSGSPSDVSNYYRPIFVHSHISKTFEFLVLNITVQPTVNSILVEEQ